jgi:hypothetical protein
MKVDVFIETGVSVSIPNTSAVDSDETYEQAKRLAREKFIEMLLNREFDIHCEYAGDD